MSKVRSVSRAVRILEAFHEGSSTTVTQLSRSLRIPKSSVYELLCTLSEEGLVEKSDGRYRLGLKLIELAFSAKQSLEVSRVARPLLEKLNEELDETVQLTILDGEEILYIDGCESSKQLRTFFDFGDRAPLHCTALGKAILAFLPPERIERILKPKSLQRFTANTLIDRKLLLQDLSETAVRGYSIDNMEHEEGVRCVGAPIRNREGQVFASISVSGPSHRMLPERDTEIARSVAKAAGEISRRLGYKPSSSQKERR